VFQFKLIQKPQNGFRNSATKKAVRGGAGASRRVGSAKTKNGQISAQDFPENKARLLCACLNHCKFTASKGIALALLLYVHQSDNHVYGSLTSFWCSLL
jgi:hypothetical protein